MSKRPKAPVPQRQAIANLDDDGPYYTEAMRRWLGYEPVIAAEICAKRQQNQPPRPAPNKYQRIAKEGAV